MKHLFVIIISCIVLAANGQTPGKQVQAKVIEGDTIPAFEMAEINIYGEKIFKSESEKKLYQRVLRHVKKVYPYAKIAEERYRGYLLQLSSISSEKEKRALMKQAEEDIKNEFIDDIRDMTFSEGKILLKLIYRQTQHTSYELLQDYRGNVRAIFWQGIARMFGANLKSAYDPEGEDKYIEEMVKLIEEGKL